MIVDRRGWGALGGLVLWAGAAWAAAPGEGYRLYLRGLLEDRAGRPQTACDFFEAALTHDPDAAAVRRALVESALAAGRVDRALPAAQALVDRDGTAESHVLLGRAYLDLNRLDKAQEAFDRALRLAPDSVEALAWATNQSRLTDPAAAAGALEKFLRENGDAEAAGGVRDRLAQLLQESGDAAGAEAHWQRLLKDNPDHPDALLGLAGLYDARGDTAAAVTAYLHYAELYPGNAEVNARLGQLLFKAGQPARAREFFDRAASARPDDPVIRFWLALAAEEEGRWADAAAHMERVARASPRAGALLRLASYYQRLGRPRDAVKALRRLQRAHPANADFAQYLAQAHEDAGDRGRAIAWYRRALSLDPRRADVWFRLAMAWDQRGRFDRAAPALEKAIALDPRHHLAMNYLGYSWADRGERLSEALGLIERAVALAPDNPAYRDSLGWVYFRLGRLPEAEAALAASVHPAGDPTVWLHYGDVLDGLGRREEAVRAWQEGLLLSPNQKDLNARLGDADRLKNVAPRTAARTALKRAEGDARLLTGFAGLADIEGRWGGQAVAGRAVWRYAAPGLFRLEILGPLFAPEVLVVHTSSGTRWFPPDRAAPEADGWFAFLGEVLSGRFAASLDDPSTAVRLEGDALIFERGSRRLTLDARRKTPREARGDGPGGPVRLSFLRVEEREGLRVPMALRVESAEGALRVEFSRVAVNAPADPAAFAAPALRP